MHSIYLPRPAASAALRLPSAGRLSPGRLEALLLEWGYPIELSPRAWEAAVAACLPARPYAELLEEAGGAWARLTPAVPLGLACLPPCWLGGLPGVLERLARRFAGRRVPWPVLRLKPTDGLLEAEFFEEPALRLAGPGLPDPCDQIRLFLNLSLYPTACRPLSRWHAAAPNNASPA
jgi:hypothetical protein